VGSFQNKHSGHLYAKTLSHRPDENENHGCLSTKYLQLFTSSSVEEGATIETIINTVYAYAASLNQYRPPLAQDSLVQALGASVDLLSSGVRHYAETYDHFALLLKGVDGPVLPEDYQHFEQLLAGNDDPGAPDELLEPVSMWPT
jgi:hypothetical protein